MELRAARRGERDEVLDLLARWYDNREFFARYNQNDPRFRDELCLIARDGTSIVATVQIFDRPIRLRGETVPMGGIGSVYTREDYRHRGIASALMRLAVETLGREGFEVSLLFAERLTFYHQFGWAEVPRRFGLIRGAAELTAPARGAIACFDEERHLRQVMEIHREYSGRIDFTALRDEAAWRGNLKFAGNRERDPGEGSEEYFVVAERAGIVHAYARATRFQGVPFIMEYGYRGGGAIDAMLLLIKHLGEVAAGRAPSQAMAGEHRRASLLAPPKGSDAAAALVTHTAHDPALERQLAGAGIPAVHHEDRNYMWRVIAPERFARRFGVERGAATRFLLDAAASPESLYWTADRF